MGWAFERKACGETLEAYAMVQQALEARLAAQLQGEDKAFSVDETRRLAAQAAYAAVQLGRLPEATALLEAGRAQQILRDAGHDKEARQYFGRYLMPQEVAQDFPVEMLIESFSHPFFWAAFTYTGL